MIVAELQNHEPETAISGAEIAVEKQQEHSLVRSWCARIREAKAHWKADFDRMRDNMRFVGGLQHAGQTKIHDSRYQVNITQRHISQKVATLYAKNPTVAATRRKRRDYQLWDGSVSSLMEAVQMAQLLQMNGMPLPPELAALFADIQNGRLKEKLVTGVGQTLEYAIQYFIDAHKPDFKEQLKQMVRRTCICGVSYIKPVFCSTGYEQPFSTDHKSEMLDRLGRIKPIVDKLREGGEPDDSPHYATLRSLMGSIGVSQMLGEDELLLPERIEFDFPCATSIIPDKRCRQLKDFIAARWVAQEYILPVTDVNAIFGTKVAVGTSDGYAKAHGPGAELDSQTVDPSSGRFDHAQQESLVRLYEVADYTTKTTFFVVDGWHSFVREPEPDLVGVSGFWKWFALTFNDGEVEEGLEITPFPQSDVDLMRHPQMEWNRSRDALRGQRNANAPKYFARKGMLTDEDKQKLATAQPNSVIEISGSLDTPLDKILIPVNHAAVDPALYDTSPMEQDFMIAAGAQQANLGPAQPNVTATVGSIAEQSRMDISSSNVDDLDGVLSRTTQAAGEMLLKGASKETIIRIVGEGSIWPETVVARRDYLNEVFLTIEAASSGRPNKAVDIQNFRDLVPILASSGANPVAIVEEGVRRLDDRLDPDKFFPLSLPAVDGAQTTSGRQSGATNSNSPQPSNAESPATSGELEAASSNPPTPPGVAAPGI